MEKCFFSETQFESYHSKQLELLMGSTLPQYFPTRNQEGFNGIDMVHFTNFHSLFFQYKVPSSIRSTYPKCASLVGDCYRMGIYNRNGGGVKGQYELLWDWAATEPHVYYASPMFHTDMEFYRNYSNILRNTAHFRFRGNFKDPYHPTFNVGKHFLYYSTNSNFGKMYSGEPVQIERMNFASIVETLTSSNPQKNQFGEYLSGMKERISTVLFNRNLIGKSEQFSEQLLSSKETAEDNYFVCNYFLQKYFALSWTVYFHQDNLTK